MQIILEVRFAVYGSLAILLLSSCSALPRKWTRKTHFGAEDLHSENPVYQVQAIRSVVENHDQTQVPALLQLMIDGEPSVRENASWGISQLTHFNIPAYQSYDSLPERQAAVNAWKINHKELALP